MFWFVIFLLLFLWWTGTFGLAAYLLLRLIALPFQILGAGMATLASTEIGAFSLAVLCFFFMLAGALFLTVANVRTNRRAPHV